MQTKFGRNPLEKTFEWLSKDEKEKSFNISALNVDWILVNLGQQNYYRVKYADDDINYNLLATELLEAHTNIPIRNRAQLLDDSFNLALAGMIPYKFALDFTKYLKNEQDYVPWNAVLSELNYIDIMLHNQPQYPYWKVNIYSI